MGATIDASVLLAVLAVLCLAAARALERRANSPFPSDESRGKATPATTAEPRTKGRGGKGETSR